MGEIGASRCLIGRVSSFRLLDIARSGVGCCAKCVGELVDTLRDGDIGKLTKHIQGVTEEIHI